MINLLLFLSFLYRCPFIYTKKDHRPRHTLGHMINLWFLSPPWAHTSTRPPHALHTPLALGFYQKKKKSLSHPSLDSLLSPYSSSSSSSLLLILLLFIEVPSLSRFHHRLIHLSLSLSHPLSVWLYGTEWAHMVQGTNNVCPTWFETRTCAPHDVT